MSKKSLYAMFIILFFLSFSVVISGANNSKHLAAASDKNGGLQKARQHVCLFRGCNKTYMYRSNLREHSRIHTGEKPYECTMCQKKFSRQDALSRHKKKYKCNALRLTQIPKTVSTRGLTPPFLAIEIAAMHGENKQVEHSFDSLKILARVSVECSCRN